METVTTTSSTIEKNDNDGREEMSEQKHISVCSDNCPVLLHQKNGTKISALSSTHG